MSRLQFLLSDEPTNLPLGNSTNHEHVIPFPFQAESILTPDLCARACLGGFGASLIEELGAQTNGAGAAGARLMLATRIFRSPPLFFPGGDLGRLAVCGVLNELAAQGGRPLCIRIAISASAELELESLDRIACSMRNLCASLGIALIADEPASVPVDPHVGLAISATAIGRGARRRKLAATQARVGDRLVLFGSVGDHGIAVRTENAGVRSDCAPLHSLAAAMYETCPLIRAMRHVGEAGLTRAARQAASDAECEVAINRSAVPVRPATRLACAQADLDPLRLASEGCFVAIVPADATDAVLEAMRWHDLGERSAVIGEVVVAPAGACAGRLPER